jgi:hypothetical protein
MALKVISNGIYTDSEKQEAEYYDNREQVSVKCKDVIEKIIAYLQGKRICEL